MAAWLNRLLVAAGVAGVYLFASASTSRALLVDLDAYVQFAILQTNGVPLPEGSIVYIVGSFDGVNNGMDTFPSGDPMSTNYVANSVLGDDVILGSVQLDSSGTFLTTLQYESDDVKFVYIRFFMDTNYPVEGFVYWGTSAVYSLGITLGVSTVVFDPTTNLVASNRNNFVNVPEPSAAGLYLIAAGMAAFLRSSMRRRRPPGDGGRGARMRADKVVILLAALSLPWLALAQEAPLFAGNQTSILDEFDVVLQGNGTSPGDLVQIMRADAGIFPPAVDGTPDTNNPVIAEGKIGGGVDPAIGDAGLFSTAIGSLQRGGGGTIQIFARAFNSADLPGASFYGNSQIYSVPTFGSNYDVFVATIVKTSEALDTSDPDGDGLHNSWEKSFGSDPGDSDTDSDGMADGHEFRAGTGITNGQSLLLCVQLQPAGGTDLRVYWDSVTGKMYRLERTLDNLSDNPVFTNVSGVLTATTWVTDTVVPGGLANPNAHYRVRLVESPEP